MSGPFGASPWGYNPSTGFYDYSIDQSLRLDGSSGYLSKNDFGTATDTAKRTFSTWIKTSREAVPASYNHIIGAASSNIDGFGFNTSEKFQWIQGGTVTKDGVRRIRDTSAWYHVFTTWNATDNEVFIYVNGELDYSSTGSISGLTKLGNTGHTTTIGKRSNQSTYINGYLAETVFLDGTIGSVSDFGETVNGVWVPKNISAASLTYGTNGFYLDYADSSDLGKDVSGRGNHFTSNSLAAEDQVPDTPTNNFGTMNSLDKSSMTVTEGALKVVPSADYRAIRGTFGIPTSGKWYFEARILTPGGGNVQDNQIGVVTQQNVLTGTSPYPQGFTYGVGYFGSGKINRAGSTAQSSLTAFTAGKILGVAVNVDDDEVQFY